MSETRGKQTATLKDNKKKAKEDSNAKHADMRDTPADKREAARQTTAPGKARSQ